jgi:DNA-directed RNA polymerase omega subunit
LSKNSYLDNKYLLTMMVAKRAKQLNQGYKPLIEMNAKSNRLLALKEVEEGLIYIKGDKNLACEVIEESVNSIESEQPDEDKENTDLV